MVSFGDTVFQALFDPLPQAVLVLRGGAIAYANLAASRLIGNEASAIVGCSIDRFLRLGTTKGSVTGSPSGLLARGGSIGPTEWTRRSSQHPTALLRGDGSLCDVLVETEALDVGAEPAVRLTIRTSFDLESDRIERADERSPTTAESELRALFRVLQDHFLRIDAQGRILEYFAPENASPFPSPMEFIGRPLHEMLPLEFTETLTEAIESALDSLRVKTIEYALPLNGVTHHFEARIAPYAADRLIAIVRDVTDRKRAEEETLLARKLESIERLAGGIAHDFNNLLTTIMAHGELANIELESDPIARRHISPIVAAAACAADLTRKLLAFSRGHVAEVVPVDLCELLTQLVAAFSRTLGDEITVKTALRGKDARVLADPRMLEKAIFNIVLNAREAMPDGGNLTIAMRPVRVGPIFAAKHYGMRQGEYCAIIFRDSGFGMTEETLRKAFDPFFTTKSTGAGRGLGLPTTHGVVKQLGGHVFALSRRGRGSTIAVYLPRVAIGSNANANAKSPAIGAPLPRRRVLVVEDEDAVREIVSRAIEHAGYVVDTAENGHSALLQFRTCSNAGQDYDAVVTDVVMPLLGGRELAQSLRAERPSQKVLFMSGYTASALDPSDLAVPGTSFLQKPFTPAVLVRELRRLIEGEAFALN